nr:hypothetical protein [Reticulibacter mediterranei]
MEQSTDCPNRWYQRSTGVQMAPKVDCRPFAGRRAPFGSAEAEVRAQATAVACSLPQTQEVPLARWSWSELARVVAASPQLPTISASTIGHWLKAKRIRPWCYHAWQHIQNPEAFLERARPVLQWYERGGVCCKKDAVGVRG